MIFAFVEYGELWIFENEAKLNEVVPTADLGNAVYVYNQDGMYLSPDEMLWVDPLSENQDLIGLQLYEASKLRENSFFSDLSEVAQYLKERGTSLNY